jgi:DNA polymerase V
MSKFIIPTGPLPPEFIRVKPDVEPCFRPLFRSIRAGFPSPALEYSEEVLDANEYLGFNPVTTFWFDVVGESMIKAGIYHQDKVLANRAIDPRNGQMVIATLNGEHTLKFLRIGRGVIELHAANELFEPTRIKEADLLLIWGVVSGSMRKVPI